MNKHKRGKQISKNNPSLYIVVVKGKGKGKGNEELSNNTGQGATEIVRNLKPCISSGPK